MVQCTLFSSRRPFPQGYGPNVNEIRNAPDYGGKVVFILPVYTIPIYITNTLSSLNS